MIRTGTPFSGFSVDDVDAAHTFYRDVLGLEVREERGMLRLVLDGDTSVLVYPKHDHAPAPFTILNFPVDDVAAAVTGLADHDVQVLRYDGLGQDADGVMRGQGPDIACFTDPAGNVLSVICLD